MVKKLYYILLILWMILIFSLSSQVQEKSHNLSTGITEVVAETIEKIVPNKEIDMKKIHHLIRKNAHFFAYFILCILAMKALRYSGIRGWKNILGALAVCVLYAISDEIHQAFVPGRGPGVKDVLIDSAGAIAGIMVYSLGGIIRDRFVGRNRRGHSL